MEIDSKWHELITEGLEAWLDHKDEKRAFDLIKVKVEMGYIEELEQDFRLALSNLKAAEGDQEGLLDRVLKKTLLDKIEFQGIEHTEKDLEPQKTGSVDTTQVMSAE